MAVALLLICAGLYSQEDSLKPKQLEEVMVVTGQYKPQSVKNSVYQVRVITKERIQKQSATKLQDVLSNELNIRFAQDLSTGGSGITMMGLKGQNVKILIDGLPMTGRQGTSNEIDINQIDINAVERIEIVEGPMSVIYGPDALAGVINIITKKTGSAKLSVIAKLHEETIGKEYGIGEGIHNQYAGLTWRKKNWEVGGGFGHNFFGGWKDSAVERELVWHKKDQLIANAFIGYNNGKLNLRYRLDGLDEVITNPGNFLFYQESSGDTLANDQEYLSQRIMQQLQASYFVNSNFSLQAQTSYTDYSRQVFSTTVSKKTGSVRLNTAEGAQSVVDFRGFIFRGTVFYKLSSLVSFQPGVDINLENGEGERLKAGNNRVNDFAFFITSEITPSSKISIRPGLRFIKNSVYTAPPVIPSVNTRFALSSNLDLRLSYARGFRSPSLRELYFNFIDANHKIIGNPGLKAETSHSFNGSLAWNKLNPGQVVYTTTLGGFYNDVNNLIDYAYSTTSDTVLMANILESKTAGVNLNTIVKYKQWNISLGTSYTGFYNDYAAADKSLPQLQWSAEINATAGYSFPKIGLNLNIFYKFTGKKPTYIASGPDIVLSEQDGYHIADFSANKKLFRYFILNAGLRNLFNVDRIKSSFVSGAIHSAGGLNVGTGRSFFAGLVYNWEKKK